jgi:hypothetical protein
MVSDWNGEAVVAPTSTEQTSAGGWTKDDPFDTWLLCSLQESCTAIMVEPLPDALLRLLDEGDGRASPG